MDSKLIQLYIYIYSFFFRFFPHIGYGRILSRVPCAVYQVLVSYLFYICVYIYIYIYKIYIKILHTTYINVYICVCSVYVNPIVCMLIPSS